MIEFLNGLTLFGSGVVFTLGTIILFIVFIFSEAQEEGTIAFGAFVLYVILFYIGGNISPHNLFSWEYLSYYIGIGIIHSILKPIIKGSLGKRINDLKDHVLRWILHWPISLLFSLFEVLHSVFNIFWGIVGSFYGSLEPFGRSIGGLPKVLKRGDEVVIIKEFVYTTFKTFKVGEVYTIGYVYTYEPNPKYDLQDTLGSPIGNVPHDCIKLNNTK